MKINVKIPRDVPFEEINIGGLFYVYDGVYIKIDSVNDSGELYNAVSLIDGSLEYIDDDKLVQRLEGELNVKFYLD